MNLKLKRTPGIYLVGFMGSGKSTIGRMLADEIGWRFGDVDDDIEHAHRKSITELFATIGEPAFRQIEHEALMHRVRGVCRGTPMVLALGGGAYAQQKNIDMLRDNGITVWIDTDFEIVRKRVQLSNHRPLARDAHQFEQLYRDRRSWYAQADFQVSVHVDDSRLALADVLKLNLLD